MPCSPSQKPCNAGEREWATGHPMMPASRAAPVIGMKRTSFPHHAAAAQERQQLDQRQPKDGKMIAVDSREQLYPSALDPVRPNRPEQRIPLCGNILGE